MQLTINWLIEKYFGRKIVIFRNMNEFSFSKQKKWLYFLSILTFFFSCKTVEVGVLQYYRPQLGVNFNNHNTVYTFDADSMFKESAMKSLDTFDLLLFNNLRHQLSNKQYIVGNNGSLQTINLEDCIVSIELKNQFATSLIACKTTLKNDSLFYAFAKIPYNKSHLDNHTNNILAAELGSAMANKIDSLQLKLLLKKDPITYSKPVEITESSGFGIVILTVLLVIVLL